MGFQSTFKTSTWMKRMHGWLKSWTLNNETFLRKIGDFLKDYGPVQVDEADIVKWKKHLVNKKLLRKSKGKYVFSKYMISPSERVSDEDKVFKGVAPIIDAIFKHADNVSNRATRSRSNLFRPKTRRRVLLGPTTRWTRASSRTRSTRAYWRTTT